MSAAAATLPEREQPRSAPEPPDRPNAASAPDEEPPSVGRVVTDDPADAPAAEGIDLSALSVAGITRRRVGWIAAGLLSAWIVVVFARQAGEAATASTRADQIARDNAALAAEVALLERELGSLRGLSTSPSRPARMALVRRRRSPSSSIRRCPSPAPTHPAPRHSASEPPRNGPRRWSRGCRSCSARRTSATRRFEASSGPTPSGLPRVVCLRRGMFEIPVEDLVFIVCALVGGGLLLITRARRRHPGRHLRRADIGFDIGGASLMPLLLAFVSMFGVGGLFATQVLDVHGGPAAARRPVFGAAGFGVVFVLFTMLRRAEGATPFSTATSSGATPTSASASPPAARAASTSRPRARPTSSAPPPQSTSRRERPSA